MCADAIHPKIIIISPWSS